MIVCLYSQTITIDTVDITAFEKSAITIHNIMMKSITKVEDSFNATVHSYCTDGGIF